MNVGQTSTVGRAPGDQPESLKEIMEEQMAIELSKEEYVSWPLRGPPSAPTLWELPKAKGFPLFPYGNFPKETPSERREY